MNSISICAHMIAGIVIHQTNITILEHIPLRISATACQSNKMHATGTSVSHAYNMVKKEKGKKAHSQDAGALNVRLLWIALLC